MTRKSKLTEDLKYFEDIESKDVELIQKLNDFMILLDQSKLDSNNIKSIQLKINNALNEKISNELVIKKIQDVSTADLNKIDQLDKLEFLLNNNFIDSKQKKRKGFNERLGRFVKVFIGFLLVTLGFAMIIMPAPPYFEMFTIFYFTQNDGFTLMDLISLIIVVTGIYIIIKSIANLKAYE